jgi:cation diffusion facilitator family transporter
MLPHDSHAFQESTDRAELKTKIVMALTGLMMVAEIAAGTAFKSMALLADGWHMSTHLSAFLIAVLAYSFARRNKDNKRFTFGTGKIGVLGGFASSILLFVVAAVMIKESVGRLLNPAAIDYRDALIVAAVGFLVNLASALILKDEGGHSRGSGHGHGHSHSHDTNLKAAYLHVIADAFTSVTAIVALLLGWILGIGWVDAAMGFVGSFVIIAWAAGMVRETVVILIDYFPESSDLEDEIRKAFAAAGGAAIEDLHVWQVAAGKFAAIISVSAKEPRTADEYYELVRMHEELVHVTVQVRG